jgi:hypothetical protein
VELGIGQGEPLSDMIAKGCVMLCFRESQGAHGALVVSF